jgi:electron transport complex protein RnfE
MMSEENQSIDAAVKETPKMAYGEIIQNGLWKQNPGIVQLLGMCPTLAMTVSLVNGFSLG